MANRISVEIALEGGAEIEKQLAGIGEAGQKAFLDISKAAEQAGGFKNIKPEEVTQKLKDMGVTGVDALQKIQAAVQSATRLESVVQGVQTVEKAFAGLATVAFGVGSAIVAAAVLAAPYLKAMATQIVDISDQAMRVGASVQGFDTMRQSIEAAGISAKGFGEAIAAVDTQLGKLQLQRVATDAETVRTGIGDVEGALKRLRDAAVQFGPVGEAAAAALLKLNIPLPGLQQGVVTLTLLGSTIGEVEKKFQGLGTEFAKLQKLTGVKFNIDDGVLVTLGKIIDALEKIKDPIVRAQAAMAFLGKAGPEFERAFQTGTLQQFRQVIIGVTTDMQKLAAQITQSQARAAAAWDRHDLIAFGNEVKTLSGLLATLAWDTMKDAASAAWNAIKTAAENAFAAVNAAAKASADQIKSLVTTVAGGAWQWIVDTFNAAVAMVGSGIEQGKQLLNAWVVEPVADAFQWMVDTFNGAIDSLISAIESARQKIVDFVTTPVDAAWQWIVDKWNAMLAALKRPFSGGNSSSDTESHASGGLLSGSGSGTSDSNLAWVSRGEYITPASAVAQPGVLAFLEALRRSGGNLRHALDGMGRFALGGMVRGPLGLPAFAGGGMNAVTINFPGLPEITGLRASSGVVDQLQRAAAMAQVRSGGRKPSRYT